jgi:inosose dehydratase
VRVGTVPGGAVLRGEPLLELGLTAMRSGTILPPELERSNILERFKLDEILTLPETSKTVVRLAGAPISWGVCEVPGWGRQLPPERVLAEMSDLGLSATELGPTGYLPTDPRPLRALLDAHGLDLVAGFVPLVLHEPSAAPALEYARRSAATLASAGAGTFLAAIVQDAEWSRPRPLDDAAHSRLVAHLAEAERIVAGEGLTLAIHPHWDTLVETASDVDRVLAASDAPWCLDTGHLFIGGVDPADFVAMHGDRIAHVHLKDVDSAVAARLRAGDVTLMQAVQAGLFRPLGQGDAGIEAVMRRLDRQGYERWLVLEQDTAITGQEPPVGSGPVVDVRASIDFLNTLALQKEEDTVA